MSAVVQATPKMAASVYCGAADGASLAVGFAGLGPVGNPLAPLSQLAANVAAPVRVAAEQVAHFIEAWRYASSALHAYMVNSRENALHFAYYAELRAALSLYAYGGISINYVAGSYYLDGNGARVNFKSETNNRTHDTVWATWPEWIKRRDAQNLLERMKLTAGVTLADFTNVLSGYAPANVLSDWGYDLISAAQDDHTARNRSSYNPLLADAPLVSMSDACVTLIRDIWRALLVGSGGITFDQDLIIFLAERSVRSITAEVKGAPLYTKEWGDMLTAVSARTGVEVAAIEQAMAKPYSVTFFERALEQVSEAENVLSRAFFLVRLASIAVDEHAAVPASSAARQWIRNWLTSVGLFPGDGSMEVADVLADYEDALQQFTPSPPHPGGLWDPQMAKHSSRLTRPEAFISWGVTL